MAATVTTISDLLHRVASTCISDFNTYIDDDDDDDQPHESSSDERQTSSRRHGTAFAPRVPETDNHHNEEVEVLMEEVFDAVSAVKRAYVTLQQSHSPWDPDKMRSADEAVVAELRRLSILKDRYRRARGGGGRRRGSAALPLREAVAPYEAALEDARREMKLKQAEVDNLKEKLKAATPRRRRGAGSKSAVPSIPLLPAPTVELFEMCVGQVKWASKSFTSKLLPLMRGCEPAARHAVESYLNRRLFEGFEDESFYMEGSLSSILDPEQHRRRCYSQFRDMRSMDPSDLLGVLPTCPFGRWAAKRYLSVMSAELFPGGGEESRCVVAAGSHPRTGFYGEYLILAKAVWMLHLLAFALDPGPPTHFEPSPGAEFHPTTMESVVRVPGGRVPAGWVVGFPVCPGFRFADGSVVRARVYPLPPPPPPPPGEQQQSSYHKRLLLARETGGGIICSKLLGFGMPEFS